MRFQSLVSVSVIQGCMLPNCMCSKGSCNNVTFVLTSLTLYRKCSKPLVEMELSGIFVHVALLNESCMYMHNALYTYLYQ